MADEKFRCDQCGHEFTLQDQDFFEGPGESWWCRCPKCDVLLDPSIAELVALDTRVRRIAARILDDIAWPFFLPLSFLTWCGVRSPTWLIRLTVLIAGPLQRRALRLRGWRPEGVSGS